jgi:hypothetical protein
VLAHRRGRHLLAFLALVGCFLVKVYMGPLAALYAIWLAMGRPRPRDRVAVVAGLGLLGTVLTVLVYLPYAGAGGKLFTSAVDVSGHFSSGSPPNLVRRLLAAGLPVLGLSEPAAAAAGARLGRQLAIAGILVAFVLVARTLRAGVDPWPRMATFFLAYLLLTPWVFYWHEVPLLGIVAAIPWSLTSLVAVTLSITLVPLAPAGPPAIGAGARGTATQDLVDTLAGFASRYGAAFLVLWLGLRDRRLRGRGGRPGRPPAAPATPARPAPGHGGSARRTAGSPPAGPPPASPAPRP